MSKLKHCISIDDFTQTELLKLLDLANQYEKQHKQPNKLKGGVVASLFFEPSTRTRLSFEAAVKYMGGNVVGFASGTVSSVQKGESLEDTIRTVMNYSDAIVMRHPDNGSAKLGASVSTVPLINAGDGSNEHPTQTLLDVYSILKTQKRLDGLNIGLAGDLRYGRTVHSLIKAMKDFGVHFVVVAPGPMQLSQEYLGLIENSKSTVEKREGFSDIDDLDILYMTRTQKERFKSQAEYDAVKDKLVLHKEDLGSVKKSFKVLHPLPRVNELDLAVDDHPAAYYFEQVRNGLFVRQALLETLML